MVTCPDCETIFVANNIDKCTECGYVFADEDEFDDD